MASKWLLYDISNIGVFPGRRGYDFRYLHRNFEMLDSFEEAKVRMKSVIRKYTGTEYGLFDEDGNLKGLKELCDVFSDESDDQEPQGVCELGSYFEEPDDNSRAFISNLPEIIKDYFSGKEDLNPVFSNYVDVNSPFLLNASCETHYEEIDPILQLGNIDESFENNERINKTDAPYLTPASDGEELHIRLSINSFIMNNPNINYFCRVTGKYNIYSDAAPFIHVELIKIEL